MNIKRIICLSLLLMLCLLPLTADFNNILDEIYERDVAPLTESVWLILAGSGQIDDTADVSVAEEYVAAHNLNGLNLTRGQLALLLMENFEIPSGLMYKITKSPRYALKDIIFLDILGGVPQTDIAVSGFELVNSLNVILEEETDHE